MNGVAWAVLARFVTVALFFDSLAPLFPEIAASHALSNDLFQLLLGACYVAFAFSQLASVPIVRSIGLYRSSALSCIYLGLATALLCGAASASLFAAVFISMFAVNGIGSNATRVALREATSDETYKRVLAWVSGAVELKQIAMPLIAGALTAAFGWRWALAALVAPVVIAGIWIEFFVPGQSGKATTAKPHAPGLSSWKAVIAMPAFVKPTLIAAAFQIAFSPLSARLPFLLSAEANLTPAMVGLVLSIASSAIAIGFFVSGYLASRTSSDALIRTGVAIIILGLVLMLSESFWGIYCTITAIVLVQAAFGFILTPCSGDVLSAPEAHRTRASAVFGFVQPIVGGLSVAVTGAIGIPQIGGLIGLTAVSLGLIVAMMIILRYADKPTLMKR